jgi:hypothetical protein
LIGPVSSIVYLGGAALQKATIQFLAEQAPRCGIVDVERKRRVVSRVVSSLAWR